MKALLIAALTLALPAPLAVAEPSAPVTQNSHAPYHDPCDCIQGTKIQSPAHGASNVVKPGDGLQDPYGANSITKTKPERHEKPLGIG